MKAILPRVTKGRAKLQKRINRLAKGAVKRTVRATLPPRQVPVKLHGNDPLAIGIEELERSFWPPARSHRKPSS